jgi:hypothetical protein
MKYGMGQCFTRMFSGNASHCTSNTLIWQTSSKKTHGQDHVFAFNQLWTEVLATSSHPLKRTGMREWPSAYSHDRPELSFKADLATIIKGSNIFHNRSSDDLWA